MKTAYFEVYSLDELKKAYKKLCFTHHPDRGGDVEIMQKVNAEYADLLKHFIDAENDDCFGDGKYWESKTHKSDVEKSVIEKLQAIIALDGLEIEIIGVWIWVSGNTKVHKETLKENGFKWINAHKKWCFMGRKSLGRGKFSMDQMREAHGSKAFHSKGQQPHKLEEKELKKSS